MNSRTRLEISPGVWLDARRAVWLEKERALVIADLHLGYAWAHRASGNLLPLAADDTAARLRALVEDFAPCEVVLLGDIVHRAVKIEPLRAELRGLCESVAGASAVHFIAGNHDRNLAPLLRECGVATELSTELQLGPHRLLHGDAAGEDATLQLEAARARGGRIFIGHEHPAVRVGNVTTVKCPCFAIAPELVILPAFSRWSAGGVIGAHEWMSPLARAAKCERAVAIVAEKLMPLRL